MNEDAHVPIMFCNAVSWLIVLSLASQLAQAIQSFSEASIIKSETDFDRDTSQTDIDVAIRNDVTSNVHDNSTMLPKGAVPKNHPMLFWLMDQLPVSKKNHPSHGLHTPRISQLDHIPHSPLAHSSRMKGRHGKAQSEHGFKAFFSSAEVDKWLLLIFTLPGFFLLHFVLLEWPSKTHFHCVALIIWLWIALIYNTLIFSSMGMESGVMWTSGYLLEVIFSLENIFVFHIVVKSLDAPRQQTQWALFMVICGQIIFELIFFVGLADSLRSLHVLPYILGSWLLFVGIQAMFQARGEHNCEEVGTSKTGILQTFKVVLGDRLLPAYGEECAILATDQDCKAGKTRVTLLGLLVFMLLLADFGLEVDVTLTKIEDVENHYLCFSSSVVATFAMPNLFFIAEDLFERYFALKYGISLVVIFLGLQMLAHQVIVIPALADCGILMGVIISCIVMSDIIKAFQNPRTKDFAVGSDEAEDGRLPCIQNSQALNDKCEGVAKT